MKKLIVTFGVLTALMFVEAVSAQAQQYVVCVRRIAMQGVDAQGRQMSCLRCGEPQVEDGFGITVDKLCGGSGMLFKELDDARKWIVQNCNCR